MPRAVRFERYGGVDVLEVVDVDPPQPTDDQVVLRVKATGINPFESKLRSGLFQADIPLSFPAAQGNDVAGVIEQVGANVHELKPGDEVLGTTAKRGSQAELALVAQARAVARPSTVPWDVAGALWTVGTTAYATVAAVSAGAIEGDVVIVAGASGGVGGLAAQLARQRGATVIGVAGEDSHAWLHSRGIVPVAYSDGLAERVARAAAANGPPKALIDTVGRGYVELAIELGIEPQRIDTIVDDEGAGRHGAKTDGAQAVADPVAAVAEIVGLIAAGELELPIAASFPLDQVREAYTLLDNGHPPGKIVLIP
jgi:NADPH:quinone reductase-like Zn-dependent oxidoreductase